MSEDEFYSMTLGNFARKNLGWIRNTWTTQRELIAVIGSIMGGQITGEDVFPFGFKKEISPPPSEEEREYMERRHANTIKLMNG